MTATIDNPLPCPWPGAEREGKACLCPNCQGVGELSWFRHIDDGVCYWCKGRGWLYCPGPVKAPNPATPETRRTAPKRWIRVDGVMVQA